MFVVVGQIMSPVEPNSFRTDLQTNCISLFAYRFHGSILFNLLRVKRKTKYSRNKGYIFSSQKFHLSIKRLVQLTSQ